MLELVGCSPRGEVERGHTAWIWLVLVVANRCGIHLKTCGIFLETIEFGEQVKKIEKFIKVDGSNNNRMSIAPDQQQAVRFTRKQVLDIVNLPPHTLTLEDGEQIQLAEDQTYYFRISLRSESPIQSFARIEVIAHGNEIVGKIVDQWTP